MLLSRARLPFVRVSYTSGECKVDLHEVVKCLEKKDEVIREMLDLFADVGLEYKL